MVPMKNKVFVLAIVIVYPFLFIYFWLEEPFGENLSLTLPTLTSA